jgi:catechol 2,3-dioxygenase-like lactoylglutathione lyase family enzyme
VTKDRLLSRLIHHVGFHVPDLQAAVDTWVDVHGAGPFYLLEHVAFDECTSSGSPLTWDHSAAFGQCGPIAVELQQVHSLRPQELAPLLTAEGRSAVNHVGVTADDAAAESTRLQSLGFELRVHARLGELEFFWHDTTAAFGYALEVITAAPAFDAFWDTVAEGARDWDGRDRLRSAA